MFCKYWQTWGIPTSPPHCCQRTAWHHQTSPFVTSHLQNILKYHLIRSSQNLTTQKHKIVDNPGCEYQHIWYTSTETVVSHQKKKHNVLAEFFPKAPGRYHSPSPRQWRCRWPAEWPFVDKKHHRWHWTGEKNPLVLVFFPLKTYIQDWGPQGWIKSMNYIELLFFKILKHFGTTSTDILLSYPIRR